MFKSLFNKTKKESPKNINWIPLTQKSQLDEIITLSNDKPQLIFKHSTRCGISRMVIRTFESRYNLNSDYADVYYLDLLNYRNISDEISEKFQIFHQSPQLIVIKNGNVVQHASHSDINYLTL